jgi:hypothetical protein
VSGRESWRPTWFDYQKCFDNFIETIKERNDVNLQVIYDGEDSENFIFDYEYPILRINAKSDYQSFIQTLHILKERTYQDDDIIYLLENDYVHTKSWVDKTKDFFEKFPEAYLSLYDHNDKYLEEYKFLESKIVVTENHHFRTTPSTCGSFMCKHDILNQDFIYHSDVPDFLYKISNIPVDHGKFLLLNLLKNRLVYSPVPALSTHCLLGLLSPTIKWETYL